MPKARYQAVEVPDAEQRRYGEMIISHHVVDHNYQKPTGRVIAACPSVSDASLIQAALNARHRATERAKAQRALKRKFKVATPAQEKRIPE